MSWTVLLKALPDPASLSGFLDSEEGLTHLITQAKGEDKKNIIRTRNKAKTLSEGKDIPSGLTVENVQENATKLIKELNAIIKEMNKKSQSGYSLENKLNGIIEEEDREGLMEFIGNSPVNKWPNKTRINKTNLLNKNKKAILNFIDIKDKEIFHFKTEDFSLTAKKPINDENWDNKINSIKSKLENTEVNIEGTDDITITFPKITSWPDMKEVLDATHMRASGKGKSKASEKEDYILFEKSGKFIKSPLLELYIKPDTTQKVKDRVRDAEIKNYTNITETKEHALKYLQLLTTSSFRRESIFIPVPKIQQGSKKVVKNVKIQLLGSALRPRLSASLAAVIKTQDFNLEKLMQEGSIATDVKYFGPRLRAILTSTEDVKIGNVTAKEIQLLKDKYKDSNEELPIFYKRLDNKEQRIFKEINKTLIGARPNLFSLEEKEMFEELAGQNPRAVSRKLSEYYNTEVSTRLSRLVEKIMRTEEPFSEIEGAYKFDEKKIKGVKYDDLRELVYELKLLRQSLTGEVEESIEVDLKDSLKLYTKGFKVNETGGAKPADMIHFLYVLDLYYGRTGFKSVAKRFKNGEAEIEELLESAEQNYNAIIDGFVEQVKLKIDDILENKETYQSATTYLEGTKKDSKRTGYRTYILFDKLEEQGLIQSITETTVKE